jgi:hypothetical protein
MSNFFEDFLSGIFAAAATKTCGTCQSFINGRCWCISSRRFNQPVADTEACPVYQRRDDE